MRLGVLGGRAVLVRGELRGRIAARRENGADRRQRLPEAASRLGFGAVGPEHRGEHVPVEALVAGDAEGGEQEGGLSGLRMERLAGSRQELETAEES